MSRAIARPSHKNFILDGDTASCRPEPAAGRAHGFRQSSSRNRPLTGYMSFASRRAGTDRRQGAWVSPVVGPEPAADRVHEFRQSSGRNRSPAGHMGFASRRAGTGRRQGTWVSPVVGLEPIAGRAHGFRQSSGRNRSPAGHMGFASRRASTDPVSAFARRFFRRSPDLLPDDIS